MKGKFRTNRHSFESYLSRVDIRLRRMLRLRVLAVLLMVLFLITLLVALAGSRFGFSDPLILGGRIFLLLAITGLGYMLWLKTFRGTNSQSIARIVEEKVPELEGRAETYAELLETEAKTPFLELLDKDASRRVVNKSEQRIVSTSRLAIPLVVILVTAGAAVWLFSAAPVLWRDGARDLWFSWISESQTVNSTIQLHPGDSERWQGEDIRIVAIPENFEPQSVDLHVRFDQDTWHQFSMSPSEQGQFEYTFFNLDQSFDYFVMSSLTKSEHYAIKVLSPRQVESIEVTYTYPDWTGLDKATDNPGGDMIAVAGTHVQIFLKTDRPLEKGELVYNSRRIPLQLAGEGYRASLEIDAVGSWYATDTLGEHVYPLTEEYTVSLVEDRPPDIRIVRPGRDWSASPIEEVSVAMEAKDDFNIESIRLHYAVNADEWQFVDFDAQASASHTFFLEDLGSKAVEESENAGLVPGDLISYYAEAKDHRQSGQTDMMFINVRPFDKNFSQSQQSASQSGQGAGNDQREISRRQREILVATWNLIRQSQKNPDQRQEYIENNAILLSEMQTTLAGQTNTLVRRSKARQLLVQDEKDHSFC